MSVTSGCPPSGFDDLNEIRLRHVVDFWNELRVCNELGATNWKVLEPIERQVTEGLYRKPPDIGAAEAFTALAMFMIAGRSQG
ncbi:MAG: hypothetical protein WD851_18370 [Pirellulales bacterium]